MYLNGIIFFLLTFFVSKLLLFRYFQKSTDLDKFLPLAVVPVIKVSIFFHMILGLGVFLNDKVVPSTTEPRWDFKWLDKLIPERFRQGLHFYQKAYLVFAVVFAILELGQRFGFSVLRFLFNQLLGCLGVIWKQIKHSLTRVYKVICCIKSTKNRTEKGDGKKDPGSVDENASQEGRSFNGDSDAVDKNVEYNEGGGYEASSDSELGQIEMQEGGNSDDVKSQSSANTEEFGASSKGTSKISKNKKTLGRAIEKYAMKTDLKEIKLLRAK